MNVADVMTRTVISVTPETTIADAAGLLLQHRISGLPVVDPKGAVVGIVTEGDLLRRTETGTERRHARWLEFLITPGRLAREYADANARKVGEVMSADIVAVTPQESLGGGGSADGAPPCQTPAGDRGQAARRHRQPRQSGAGAAAQFVEAGRGQRRARRR